jgi:hypothetical protein
MQDSRQRAVEEAGSSLRLTAEVLDYMEAAGDVRLLFAATVLTLAVPRTLHHARANVGTPGSASSSHLIARRPTVISCNLLARDKEAVLAVGTKSVYVLPSERIPIDDILEFVVHAHCSAPFPALEIRVANPDGTNDVRFIALSSDYMLRQAVAVLQTACPFARIVFHSHGWISRRGERGSSPSRHAGRASRGADDSDDDDDMLRRARMTNVASDTAQKRLLSYRKQKMHSDAAVAKVSTYGPGRYGEAADALSNDLGRMMNEVERMMHTTSGDPIAALTAGQPISSNPNAKPPPPTTAPLTSSTEPSGDAGGGGEAPHAEQERKGRIRRSTMIRSKGVWGNGEEL